MKYWIWLKEGGEPVLRRDYFLEGLVPEHVVELMTDASAAELDICDGCEAAFHCHVIEEDTGVKYCPVLFHDVVKPDWKVEDLV